MNKDLQQTIVDLGDRRSLDSTEVWKKIVNLCVWNRSERLQDMDYGTSNLERRAMVCFSLLNTYRTIVDSKEFNDDDDTFVDAMLYQDLFLKAVDKFDKDFFKEG